MKTAVKIVAWVLGGTTAFLLLVAGCAALVVSTPSEAPAPSTAKSAEVPAPSTAKSAEVPASAEQPSTDESPSVEGYGDGIFLVGTEIAPGRYKSAGNEFCYWERLKDTDGGLDSIIANGAESGNQIVTIKKTDYAFSSQGCNEWVAL